MFYFLMASQELELKIIFTAYGLYKIRKYLLTWGHNCKQIICTLQHQHVRYTTCILSVCALVTDTTLTTLFTGKLIPSSADIYGAISACAMFLALFIDISDSVVASPLTPAPHDTRGVSVSDASPEPWLPAGQYYFSI